MECEVVVKIGPRTDDKPRAAKICREATALHKLSHPAFVRIYDCDHSADGAWYLVEEYIRGETLAARLGRGRLDVLAAVETISEIAEALGEAHARGVVHGDVHPGNFIIEHGPTPRVRVIDLSDCRLLDHFFAVSDQRYAETPPHRGDAGPNFGHPDWVAPEVGRGIKHTPRSDVFSLGLILYALITGSRNGGATVRKLSEAGPRDALGDRLREVLLEAAPVLDESELLEQIENVLAPEPEHRTVTMAHLGRILRDTAVSIREVRTPSPSAHRTVAPTPAVSASPPTTTLAHVAPALPASAPPPQVHFERVTLAVGGAVVSLLLVALVTTASWSFARPGEVESPRIAGQPQAAVNVAPAPQVDPPQAATSQAEPPPQAAKKAAPTQAHANVEPAAPAVDITPPRARSNEKPRSSSLKREVRPDSKPRHEAVTAAEATRAAEGALEALRACAGAPAKIAADLSMTRGRAVVSALNLAALPPSGAPASWQECIREQLERLSYPVSETASRVRVRLKLR